MKMALPIAFRTSGPLVALAAALACAAGGLVMPAPGAAGTTPSAATPASAARDKKAVETERSARSLFDGKTLSGWKVADFAGSGAVRVDRGRILMEQGVMTGITWTNDLPRTNYEVTLEAMRVEGSDFFCALTFPVGPDPCTLIVGGWGGGLVGLSSLDGEDAANNETTKMMSFTNGVWYEIRLRVTTTNIQAWIDEEKMVDVATKDRKISIRWECEPSKPLGIATWATTGAVRNLELRRLP